MVTLSKQPQDQDNANTAAPTASQPARKHSIYLKVALALGLVSTVMTAGFYNVLQAQSVPLQMGSAQGKQWGQDARTLSAQVTKIELSGPIDLVLQQNATPSMQVEADRNLLASIETSVEGDTLRIRQKGITYNSGNAPQVTVSLPQLQSLKLNGSGATQATGFNGDSVELTLRGSGDLDFTSHYKNINATLHGSGNMHLNNEQSEKMVLELTGSGGLTASGNSHAVNAKLNGSGDLNAADLTSDSADVELIGSGNLDVNARQTATIVLRGSGDVHVAGKPPQRSTTIKGSGDIEFD